MYGLEAIAAHNGWAQALTGATIVMSGLAILATVISFLPKLVALFEEDEAAPTVQPKLETSSDIDSSEIDVPAIAPLQDIKETATVYSKVIEPLGESFLLSDLYEAFRKHNLPHPHLTIKSLREADLISPAGEGLFTLKLNSE